MKQLNREIKFQVNSLCILLPVCLQLMHKLEFLIIFEKQKFITEILVASLVSMLQFAMLWSLLYENFIPQKEENAR